MKKSVNFRKFGVVIVMMLMVVGNVIGQNIPVSGVTLDRTNLNLVVGATQQLNESVMPLDASNKKVDWTSSNENVATVNSNGKVTSVKAGNCLITVTTQNSGKTAICQVIVSDIAVPVSGISLDKVNASIFVGQTLQLNATIAPTNATNQTLIWSSDNTNVLTVDQYGIVTGKAVGKANAIVTTQNGGFIAKCEITVSAINVPVSGISLDKTNLTLLLTQTAQLNATIAPVNANNQNVIWASSNENVATVKKDGTIKPVASGSCIITVKSENGGFEAKCNLIITQEIIAVSGVGLNKDKLNLVIGQTYQLIPDVKPGNATNQNLIWTSDNSNVLEVSTSGLLTAKQSGTVKVTVKTVDGEFKANCDVTISPVAVPVSGLALDKASATMLVGESLQLTGTLTPAHASNQNILWSSDNENVASVNGNGKIKALKAGKITITAKSENGGFVSTCVITVLDTNVPVESVSLDKSSASLIVGQKLQLNATVKPNEASNKKVSWSTSNANVASVDATGTITALKAGQVDVMVTTENGGMTAICSVTVKEAPVSVSGVSLNKTTLSLEEGDSEKLTATITPANATDQTVTWKSSDESLATVNSSGKVTAVKAGTTTITVKTSDGGFEAKCTVTVTKKVVAVTGVLLNKTTANMVVGDTITLKETITPADATNQEVTWSSSNESVVVVNNKGRVIAKGVGTAVITVTTKDGGKTATCSITVSDKPISVTGISLNLNDTTLVVGENVKLIATIVPSNATNQKVTWKSSNEAVATVNDNGKVAAIGEGTTTITVKTDDGNFKAMCNITVVKGKVPVTSVSLSQTNLSLEVNGSATLIATVNPADATDKTVTWTSSNNSIATVVNGVVTAHAVGNATITITTKDGNKTATCAVNIVAQKIPVNSVSLNTNTINLNSGSSYQLIATVNPSNATNKAVVWSSSDNNVATVNSDGLVKAFRNGTTTITVTTVDGNFKATCQITVSGYVAVTGISLNYTERWMGGSGRSFPLEATITPTNATNKTIIWSYDSSVVGYDPITTVVWAKVDNGYTVITATTEDGGYIASCKVTIGNGGPTGIEGVSADGRNIYVSQGMLIIDTPTLEKIQIFNLSGNLLYSGEKPVGEFNVNVQKFHVPFIIVRGKGWTKKVIIP